MTVAALVICALALAWANGSNDNLKAVATLYGAGTVTYRKALAIATAAQLAGSVGSVLLAGKLLKAFSGKGLVPTELVADPSFLLAVGVGAAVTVLLASRFGIPVSTTHALIGGLVGAGLALAPTQLSWAALGGKYFLPLAVSPVLAVVAAAGLYPAARAARRAVGWNAETCLCVGGDSQQVVAQRDGTMMLRSTGRVLEVGEMAACRRRYEGSMVGVSAQSIVDAAHTASGFALGFARGLNDTPKVLALLVAAGWSGMNPRVSLAVVALAMAAGGIVMARRVAETMGRKITSLNPGQGLVANAISSGLVIGASLMGSPVSTTHVSTGAIFGIGTHTGTADRRVVGGIVLAWVATLPIAAVIAAAVAWGLAG